MGKIYTSVDQLIGGTPLLELTHLERELGLSARILGKLESFNPGGSAKDRIAKSMLDDGEARGILKSGSVIIEPTSGNTGIGLALVAAARGYRAIIVMPDTMSQERRQLLLAYGAEVVLTEGRLGMAGAIARAEELAREIPGSFIPGQFENRRPPHLHRPGDLGGHRRDGGHLRGRGRLWRHHHRSGRVPEIPQAGRTDRGSGTRLLPRAQRWNAGAPRHPGHRGRLRPSGAGHRDL